MKISIEPIRAKLLSNENAIKNQRKPIEIQRQRLYSPFLIKIEIDSLKCRTHSPKCHADIRHVVLRSLARKTV